MYSVPLVEGASNHPLSLALAFGGKVTAEGGRYFPNQGWASRSIKS